MSEQKTYRKLTDDEIKTLMNQGNSSLDWQGVQVAEGFNPFRVRNTHFTGNVRIGAMQGTIAGVQGMAKTTGIYNAAITDCTIGSDVRIANVGVHIANYDIGDRVCIENVGTIQTRAGSTFGNGTEIEVLNEGGGREVIIFDELSVQFAYLMCLHCYRPELIRKLTGIAQAYVEQVRGDRGKIGIGVKICSVQQIMDVNIRSHATVNGAASLVNGTILSEKNAPTIVGTGVIAKDFIIAESSSVTDGALISKTFVGQGCQIGKQFSAEGCLFFANCEGFHGEACSVFAGPYTVTHHKSTLLIAGLFSFYNAGSGTNQSNHLYKLGPIHEGKLERGSKTGSFAYMMWPCRVGAFSVVLGKHSGTFDTTEYPFAYIEAKPNGKTMMVPGLNMTTVGTLRDAAKWPSRDRRKGSLKRDVITFDVFSPYTVGKMIKAAAKLTELSQSTDKSIEEVSLGGALVRRTLLRTGARFYRNGSEMVLLEKIFKKVQEALSSGDVRAALAADARAVYSADWVDIGGQLMPKQRLLDFCEAIEKGVIAEVSDFQAALQDRREAYEMDEWAWVKEAATETLELNLENAGKDDLLKIAERHLETRRKFLKLVIADAQKEFDELSHTGFGQDGSVEDAEADFTKVRGVYPENKFVKEMHERIDALEAAVKDFKEKLERI